MGPTISTSNIHHRSETELSAMLAEAFSLAAASEPGSIEHQFNCAAIDQIRRAIAMKRHITGPRF